MALTVTERATIVECLGYLQRLTEGGDSGIMLSLTGAMGSAADTDAVAQAVRPFVEAWIIPGLVWVLATPADRRHQEGARSSVSPRNRAAAIRAGATLDTP